MDWTVGLLALVALGAAIALAVWLRKGFFPEDPPADNSDGDSVAMLTLAQKVQSRYWEPNAEEKAQLLKKPIQDLDWKQRLRLLHLVCAEMLANSEGRQQSAEGELDPEDAPEGGARELVIDLVKALMSESSPFRSRFAIVGQGDAEDPSQQSPDNQGVLRNASLTHLGSLEVIHLDENQLPTRLSFVPLDDLRGVIFGQPALYQAAKLLYDNGESDEVVLSPLLYGLSWNSPNAFDKDGSFTRFICNVPIEEQKSIAIGVGRQDLLIEGDQTAVFGLGSFDQLTVALSVDDPKFESKCRFRGLDPEETRRAVADR